MSPPSPHPRPYISSLHCKSTLFSLLILTLLAFFHVRNALRLGVAVPTPWTGKLCIRVPEALTKELVVIREYKERDQKRRTREWQKCENADMAV